MTEDQKLHWQIAATIFAGSLVDDMSEVAIEAYLVRSVEAAEKLRLMVVGDWKGGGGKVRSKPFIHDDPRFETE